MSYNAKSTDGMNEDELRMFRSSLRRDLIAKKEDYKREQHKIEQIDLESRYLSRDKDQIAIDIENRRGRIKAIENEINRLIESTESNKKTKKSVEAELDRMQKQMTELDTQIKNKNHEKEKWQDEMRDMDREIKKLEIQIREM